LSVDFSSGLVHWQPSEAQLGNHKVVVEADDRHGGVATQTFDVNVQSSEQSVPAAPAAPAADAEPDADDDESDDES
jgi:hypothetical protein